MRVALVHDWLTGMRGGERVLERVCGLFPDADIHTLLWNRGACSATIERHPIRTSWLQYVPGAGRRYRWLLPFYPGAIESLDLSGYDAVISMSHAVAKSARTGPATFHLSYVFTPMRYIWELEDAYFPPGRYPWPLSWYVRRTCASLRRWDAATSSRAHAMIAISRHVAGRIREHYGRDAEVIYPPVGLDRFAPRPETLGPRFTPRSGSEPLDDSRPNYMLLAGARAPYKHGELAVRACAQLGLRLVVAGAGPMEAALRALGGAGVEFRSGWVPDDEMARLYAGASALLFPGEEDFGIVPLEAMASGRPVIALGVGGAIETVGRGADPAALAAVARGGVARVPGGVLFGRPTLVSMVEAMRELERAPFDPAALVSAARPFGEDRFDAEFAAAFERHHATWRASRA